MLWVISHGAVELIADMTATVLCHHAGADAVVRAYQRAAANGTRLRLVITAQIVRRVIALNGLDRMNPVYTSLEAATATTVPAALSALDCAQTFRCCIKPVSQPQAPAAS